MSRARYVNLKKESVYGTAEGSAGRYEDAVCKIQPNPNWLIPAPVAQRAYKKRSTGLIRSQGNIGDFAVTPCGIIGDLLLGALGTCNSALQETGVYLHTFTPADTIPSYTGRIGVEQIERILPGCLVEELNLKFVAGQSLTANALIYSGFSETSTTIGAPTTDTVQAFTQIDDLVNFTLDSSDRSAVLSELSIKIKNNIPFTRGDLSGRTFSKIRTGQRKVTGNLTAYFDDTVEFDDFKNGTAFDIIAGLSGVLAGDTYRYVLTMNLYECQFMQNAAPDIKEQSEPLVINAPFQAFYKAEESTEVKGYLQNTISSY